MRHVLVLAGVEDGAEGLEDGLPVLLVGHHVGERGVEPQQAVLSLGLDVEPGEVPDEVHDEREGRVLEIGPALGADDLELHLRGADELLQQRALAHAHLSEHHQVLRAGALADVVEQVAEPVELEPAPDQRRADAGLQALVAVLLPQEPVHRVLRVVADGLHLPVVLGRRIDERRDDDLPRDHQGPLQGFLQLDGVDGPVDDLVIVLEVDGEPVHADAQLELGGHFTVDREVPPDLVGVAQQLALVVLPGVGDAAHHQERGLVIAAVAVAALLVLEQNVLDHGAELVQQLVDPLGSELFGRRFDVEHADDHAHQALALLELHDQRVRVQGQVAFLSDPARVGLHRAGQFPLPAEGSHGAGGAGPRQVAQRGGLGEDLQDRLHEGRRVDEIGQAVQEAGQVRLHVLAALVPVLLAGRQRPAQDLLELHRDPGVDQRRRGDLGTPGGLQGLVSLEGGVRVGPGHHLVQDQPHGEDVGATVHGLGAGLLGGHVMQLSAQDPLFLVAAQGLGDAEVGDLHGALAGEQDVLRAHVAVDQLQRTSVGAGQAMCVVQSAQDLGDDVGRQPQGQGLLELGVLADQFHQVDAVDELHDHIQTTIDVALLRTGLAVLEHLHHVGVVQFHGQFGFIAERVAEVGVGGERLQDPLQGHGLAQTVVVGLGQVHIGHAALADFVQQRKLPDFLYCFQGTLPGRTGSAGSRLLRSKHLTRNALRGTTKNG